ncbi:hypothetical protein [Peterkaempfera griseoplana]|uniref:hypothetical protein n=1 Tax=Peterkaempfera griseoplana TaxID=66896 RepID=UPI0006E24168|nr:hypothetical protein [Peterkaempfera griseoplana]
MARSAGRPGRADARLGFVWLLLLGLFLMHGSPAAAATGCHGSAPAAVSAAMADDGAADAAAEHAHAADRPGAVVADASGGRHASGVLCVSTPARDHLALPLGLVAITVAVGIVAVLVGAVPRVGGATRRGPPRAGRRLLAQVCIART